MHRRLGIAATADCPGVRTRACPRLCPELRPSPRFSTRCACAEDSAPRRSQHCAGSFVIRRHDTPYGGGGVRSPRLRARLRLNLTDEIAKADTGAGGIGRVTAPSAPDPSAGNAVPHAPTLNTFTPPLRPAA
eukprot:scaffold28325_cov96-Isochrysis_galbana.AAC.1